MNRYIRNDTFRTEYVYTGSSKIRSPKNPKSMDHFGPEGFKILKVHGLQKCTATFWIITYSASPKIRNRVCSHFYEFPYLRTSHFMDHSMDPIISSDLWSDSGYGVQRVNNFLIWNHNKNDV